MPSRELGVFLRRILNGVYHSGPSLGVPEPQGQRHKTEVFMAVLTLAGKT